MDQGQVVRLLWRNTWRACEVAALNPRYRSALQYALTPTALLDLAAMASLAVPYVGLESTIFRLLQIARILRLARIGRYSRAMNLLAEAIRCASGGTGAVFRDGPVADAGLGNAAVSGRTPCPARRPWFYPRAMWWAVETLTTVGYGDVVPITALGRLLAAVTALGGIGIIALPTGVLAGAFSDAIRRAREEGLHRRHHDPAP
ncbi:MAG: ion channel [Paracoccaceae bacterium]